MKTCTDKYSILLSNILKEASTIYQRQEGDTLQQGFGLVGVRNGKGDRLGDVIIDNQNRIFTHPALAP